jgi:hypothetical protein
MTRDFDSDPVFGIRRLFHYDADSRTFTIETQQDVQDIVEWNRAEYNEYTSPKFGTMRKVASIPLPLYYELKRRGIIDDEAALKRWLNDPDNRFLRTAPGVI